MISDPALWTFTLAELYARQGYLQQAAQILRHLLQNSPDSPMYIQALDDIESRLAMDPESSEQTLVQLMATWIDLEMGYARLKQMKGLPEILQTQRAQNTQ